ncbi:sensor domain-containing protein [Stutzerimonas kirkiae]|uniref:cyclic-guanylate-specific phosphodiesterase n=1 Tax=Stutzerimonas kirkiae TaxID=2211392 RepID=A0A4Q9QXB0_9GAMM|nr:EAL domain-containing protein [Stutzerimonas kirkiae]TBU89290.1 bifunctional diguanylate cyclase/phosphodiesterase [Stutzerimonas kirkiae]TBU99668.1 bifunctional diguanylate cyclase/phosphodiesterase [Stutzerimonas kirkiae]TBV12394.1 bifunctional diguanylate cyclase/phosphodiesterase [Stutzerimonas kirkiae]TBV12595.1 bifunctional diguanylate cyclase/phosphodiesterase [Stutzerimonas kirkiae]
MSVAAPREAQQQALLTALDRSMAIIEFAPDGQVLRANRNYLDIFGYSEEQILQRSHGSFCVESHARSEDYRIFWDTLLSGRFSTGLYQRVAADGHCVWLEASYNPIHDSTGALLKIVKFASDVTARIEHERQQREYIQRLALSADKASNTLIMTDRHGAVVYANQALTQLFGFQPGELLGQPMEQVFNLPHAGSDVFERIHSCLLEGRSYHSEEMIIGKFNQPLWCSLSASPVLDEQNQLNHCIIALTDITTSRMREMLQHKVLEAMAREASLTDVMLLICREVERIAPEVIASILQVDEQDCLRPLASPSLPESYAQALDGLPIGPCVGSCGTAAFRNAPVLVRDIATDPLWSEYKALALPLGLRACWSTPIPGGDGKAIGTFAFYYRESRGPDDFHKRLVEMSTHLCSLALERESARLRIRQLAFYDSLTGLPNRSLLLAQAEQAIANAKRQGENLMVLFIDLDRFKQVNDSLGHPAGDELLGIIAQRLREQMRGGDIVGRLSGDEFVVLLNPCTTEQATNTIERLQELLSQPCRVAGVTLTPSASIGISQYPENGHDMETLLHRADLAMYQAKANGRSHFSFFSDEMNQLAQERLALETALREALQQRTLTLHYQPQINLESGRLHGIEALARWHHPTFGNVSPMRFIPLAEECGLIGQLGQWALEESCRQLAAWRRAGLDVPAISVNLSPTNFHNLELTRYINDTLSEHALAPRDLTLEITESVLLDTNPSTLRTLNEVHAQGIGLSMDDFGTGYSSLGYLRRLPLDELKLDKIFVHDMEHDETALALTHAVIRIGESLKMTVVAEGVETQAQRELLEQQGYKVAQGYLFSRPLAPEQMEDWLRRTVDQNT